MGSRYQTSRNRADFRAIDEQLREKQRDVKMIFAENRLIAEDNSLLKRELAVTRDEIHRVSKFIPSLRAQKGAGERELIEREVTLKADLRAAEPVKAEVAQLRSQVQVMNSLSQDLCMQVQGLTNVVDRFKDDNQKLVLMRTDVEMLNQKLADARKDLEYEKKAKEEQVEQKGSIEKNILFMVNEIEKLKEQLNAERRAHDFDVGGSERLNGSSETRYRGAAWEHYGKYDLARR